MRDILMKICVPGIWAIVVLEIIFLVLLIKEYKKYKKPIILCIWLITLGLIVDAIVIGLGAVLPNDILLILSRIRFVAHGVLIPLIFPICGYALNAKQKLMNVIWAITVIMMIAGVAEGFAIDLQMSEIASVTRMLSSENTPAWAEIITMILSFGTVIPLIVCGIVVLIKQKNVYLFLSGLFMFIFSALGPATGNADLIFFISMIGEVLMVGFFYLFVKKK